MIAELEGCGPAGFLLVFLGVTGFVASLLSLVFVWNGARIRFVMAFVTMLLGAATLAFGFVAQRRVLEQTTTFLEEHPADADEQSRLRDSANAIAHRCLWLGIQSGTMPLMAGLVGLTIAWLDRKRPPADDFGSR